LHIKISRRDFPPGAQLVKKVPSGFFTKLLSELQNLQHDFAILPLRRVIKRERTP